MTAEGWTIIGAAIALVGAFTPVLMGIRRDLTGLTRNVADLRERMARLEGLFEGFIRRDGQVSSPSARGATPRTRSRGNVRGPKKLALATCVGYLFSPSSSKKAENLENVKWRLL